MGLVLESVFAVNHVAIKSTLPTKSTGFPIHGFLAMVSLTLKTMLSVWLPELETQIDHSIHTLYQSLCLTLLSPSLILASYSAEPAPYYVRPK